MSKVLISFACRVEFTSEQLEWASHQSPGKTEIPGNVLPPRQVKFSEEAKEVPVSLMRWHRDGFVPIIRRAVVEAYAKLGQVKYLPQYLLMFSKEDYLADPDVQRNEEETQRVLDANPDKVIVAVIGDNRSALSVCRNIVSGCQNPDTLVSDAEGAIESASVFLIED